MKATGFWGRQEQIIPLGALPALKALVQNKSFKVLAEHAQEFGLYEDFPLHMLSYNVRAYSKLVK